MNISFDEKQQFCDNFTFNFKRDERPLSFSFLLFFIFFHLHSLNRGYCVTRIMGAKRMLQILSPKNVCVHSRSSYIKLLLAFFPVYKGGAQSMAILINKFSVFLECFLL